MRPVLVLALLALVVGVVDALVFVGFEWVVNHGTDWLWNDLAGSDDVRWRVVPLALGLSIAFSAVAAVARGAALRGAAPRSAARLRRAAADGRRPG